METLEVTIIPEDFKNAPRGFLAGKGNEGCVLQQALRRMFPNKYVGVGAERVYIGKLPDQAVYTIDTAHWGSGNHPEGLSSSAINEYSAKAKESLDGIPSKTLYLQPLVTSIPVLEQTH